ncbi:MAG TPA: NADH-quinone oxidoreductase subunit E, partial [Actinobacteria bacterium]|nr:NADH-quinone oxidoreductase subunit E [Actinomycetota bacterium]
GKPTAVNNVETLAAAAAIVAGTPGAGTTKLFSVSGDVPDPGVVEAPFGATVRELLTACGRTEPPAAVLLGGAAGRFLAPAELDAPLGYDASSPPLGSGAVMVFGADVDLADVVERIARFFRSESCGQCVPCRVGTVRQEEALRRLAGGADEAALLDDVAAVLRDASICGLGQTAAEAVVSALELGLIGGGR